MDGGGARAEAGQRQGLRSAGRSHPGRHGTVFTAAVSTRGPAPPAARRGGEHSACSSVRREALSCDDCPNRHSGTCAMTVPTGTAARAL